MSRVELLLSALFLLFLPLPVLSQANPSKAKCIAEVNATYNQVIRSALETRKNGLFVCRAGSPERAACLQNCIQSRNACLKPIDDQLRACYTAADNAFLSGRAACRVSAGCTRNCGGNPSYQTCMVNVRIKIYNDNRNCRVNDNKEGRKICRKNFITCNRACGPTPS